MTRAIGLVTVLLMCGLTVLAQPQFRNAGAFLISEKSSDRIIVPGEQITVRLALKNIGDAVVSNLVGTLQTNPGVSNLVSATQNYGTLAPCAESVGRDFTFTCAAPSNSLLVLKLDLADSANNFGTVEFRFGVARTHITEASTPLSVMIPTLGVGDPYPSVITITNVVGRIDNVSVTLSNLNHLFPDDLDILLVSPGGDAVLLMSDACGSGDFNNVTLTFTDDTEAILPDTTPPDPLTVRPTNYGIPDAFSVPAPAGPYAGVMSAFNGKDPNGEWQLYIVDDSARDGGLLQSGWSLTLRITEPVDSAPTLTLLGRSEDNNMIRFAVGGRPGRKYTIESSPDPLGSVTLEYFTMPAEGVRIFEYPLGPEDQFFRAATDP